MLMPIAGQQKRRSIGQSLLLEQSTVLTPSMHCAGVAHALAMPTSERQQMRPSVQLPATQPMLPPPTHVSPGPMHVSVRMPPTD